MQITKAVIKSQKHRNSNKYIKSEVSCLVESNNIEPSKATWCAQVLVIKYKVKQCIVVDYSETINIPNLFQRLTK